MQDISDAQLERYARQVILEEIGWEGQKKLLAAKVLIVGAGGLGSPLALYLAGAGIGEIGLIDDDRVDLSNLQRQILHGTADIGQAKTESAKGAIQRLNPETKVTLYPQRLTEGNAAAILSAYDIIADGSDNFATRYLLNDHCHPLKKTWISASLLRFDGQLTSFKSYKGKEHPCYRCLFPTPPPADIIPRCEQAGILGSVAGILGTLQATEVVKEILSLGATLSGRLLLIDALAPSFTFVTVKKNPLCPLCGDSHE